MKTNYLRIILLSMISSTFLFFSSCTELDETIDEFVASLDNLGYFGSPTDTTNIESDIYLGNNNTSSLPTSVDLRSKFPPIGNQGRYGTCVAWAVGYNMKTFIEGKDKNYSSSQLSQASNQFSPKDLFWAIPNSKKGNDCNGTGFEQALDVMVSRGIAPMSEVPYDGLGDCSSSPQSSWTSSANNYKIDNYRKINKDKTSIKNYLNDGRVIAFGAKLGDEFMKWNTDDVIDYDTYNNPGMQHAYHAMALAGYDDNRGANGAFLVVNSWGTSWGNNGYIWIDQDFFISSNFCFAAYVATNKRSNPDDDGNNQVDDDDINSGYDLTAWNLQDIDYYDSEDPRVRFITYNVFNTGTNTIKATDDWNIVYAYYNAYDANEYGILVYDYYTDDYGDNERHYDPIPAGDAGAYGLSANWWNNIDVPSGQSVAQVLTNTENFDFKYEMPSSLTGHYYLVLIADGFDVLQESNESNNYYYFTKSNGDPIYIENGEITGSVAKLRLQKQKPQLKAQSPSPTAINKRNVNSYSPRQITKLIKHQRQTGELQRKVQKFLKKRTTNATKIMK